MSAVPSAIWRSLSGGSGYRPLPRGLDAAWDVAVGAVGRMVPRLRLILRRARRVEALAGRFAGLTDRKLREQALGLKEVFRRGRARGEDVEAGFALVREVAARVLGERPFLVQVAGALAIHAGCVAEMATGEGKTLAATMPATLAGWRGRGCHLITVNDYLAQRDAEWMGPIYRFCGLTVAYVQGGMDPRARRAAYAADITYTTNKEVTADYLRDLLALGRRRDTTTAILTRLVEGGAVGTDRLVLRGLEYAIVDEADSVLIDEGVTPLIISGQGPNPEQVEAFRQAARIAAELEPGRHYRVNHRYREVDLTEAGKRRLEELSEPFGGVWRGRRRREELVNQALVARELYHRDKQYVVLVG